MSPEELLVHANFVQTLAKSLVTDKNQADDIEQQTWLAALQNPPKHNKSIRSWLATVALNAVRRMYRDQKLQKKHESFTPPKKITPPDKVYAQEELRRQLIAEVLNLKDPYKTAILLRYYDGLKPQEIADHLKMPVNRVWTHLKRGLSQLRQKLDAKHQGNREKWVMALYPIIGVTMGSKKGAATLGALLMGAKAKAVLFVVMLFSGVFAIYQFQSEDPPSRLNLETKDASRSKLGMIPEDDPKALKPPISSNSEKKQTISPTSLVVSGRVMDNISKQPIQAFNLKIFTKTKTEESCFNKTFLHKEGAFSFPLPIKRDQRFELRISSSCYRQYIMKDLVLKDPGGLTDLLIEMDSGLSIKGVVLEDATGLPVKGALIGPARHDKYIDLKAILLDGDRESFINTVTDEKGCFFLQGLDPWEEKIAVVHPDFAQGYAETVPGSLQEVQIRLKKGFRIFGKTLNDNGDPGHMNVVSLRSRKIPLCCSVYTQRDGSFRTSPVHPGTIYVSARGGKGFSEEQKIVDVIDQDVEVNFGPLPEHAQWRGRLLDENNNPLVHAVINLKPAHYGYNDTWDLTLKQQGFSQEDGKFEIKKLNLGCHQIHITLENGVEIFCGEIEFTHSGVLTRDIILNQQNTVKGVVVNSKTNAPFYGKKGVIWASSNSYVPTYGENKCQINENGEFEMKGIAPGIYSMTILLKDMLPKFAFNIKVKNKEQTVLRIPVDPGGTLSFKAFGFSPREPYEMVLSSIEETYDIPKNLMVSPFSMKGTLEFELPLQSGLWALSFAFKDLGIIHKEFEILPGMETKVTLDRQELILNEEKLTVTGKLCDSNGAPIPHAKLRFDGRFEETIINTESKEDGSFIIKGINTGCWHVNVEQKTGESFIFSSVRVSKDHSQLHLIIPKSVVTGRLFCAFTGKPLENMGKAWAAVILHDIEKDDFPCYSNALNGNRFKLVGRPHRIYEIIIKAQGYRNFVSRSFSLDEAGHVDIGDIRLAPCAILHLQVTDRAGNPVPSFDAFHNGKKLDLDYDEANALFIKGDLPIGPAKIRISAKGYKENAVQVELLPATPVLTRVILNIDS